MNKEEFLVKLIVYHGFVCARRKLTSDFTVGIRSKNGKNIYPLYWISGEAFDRCNDFINYYEFIIKLLDKVPVNPIALSDWDNKFTEEELKDE